MAVTPEVAPLWESDARYRASSTHNADGCDDSISDSDDIAAIRDDLKAAIGSFLVCFSSSRR